jgi:hypothetical protein
MWYAWKRKAYNVLAGNLKERDHLEGLSEDRKILKWIINMIGVCGLDSSDSQQALVAGLM